LRQAGFQEGARTGGGRGFGGEFLLLDGYEISDGVFQFSRAGAAFPTGFQVCLREFLFVRGEFAFEI
jgi:hypothetical protein